MAKKKVEKPADMGGAKVNILTLRGSGEWRAWLKEAADHDRCQSVADFIDRAVAAYARQTGFKKAAPKR